MNASYKTICCLVYEISLKLFAEGCSELEAVHWCNG